MTPEQLKARLETLSEGTEAQVMDLTGTQDHYRAVVISPAFEGKNTLQQHRMVYALVDAELKTGEVHAFSMKTLTPQEAQNL